MVFSSFVFLWGFLPILIVLYYFLPHKWRNALLVLASLFFYAWGEPRYVLIMCVTICVNFGFGKLLGRVESKHRKKYLLSACLANILFLVFFKYMNFITGSLSNIFYEMEPTNIHLPIGISFYTFQSISYLIDVYRKRKCDNTDISAKSLLDLFLYISFFPQLIAGPIVKWCDINEQISDRKTSFDDFYYGAKRFIIGLGKKIIIANQMAAVVDNVFESQAYLLNSPLAWITMLCYSLQILFDFSGYSDMAIGLGRMFGFHFMENFDKPYMSKSITEFWRRWHISLSTWFKEYVYIPLGGNRRGIAITCRNLLIVFALTGLWHGANWTFIIWGMIYGLIIILEKLCRYYNISIVKNNIIKQSITLFIVALLWIVFRADSLSEMLDYYRSLFSFSNEDLYPLTYYVGKYSAVIICVGVLLCGQWTGMKKKYSKLSKSLHGNIIEKAGLFAILFLCFANLACNQYNPFIYFRF